MRTRFAPSPTGNLHVGGLRTALMSYLLAKQSGGQFLLRIEDTDRAREVPGAIDQILCALQWAGIPPDEGVIVEDGIESQRGDCGPYKQSERLHLYRTSVDQLLTSGHAYHCFCSQERLEIMRKEQEAKKQAPMYDRLCLSLTKEEVAAKLVAEENHVIRLKIPRRETITFDDDIRGPVSFRGETIDDQVLLKSDGFPTYHLAHVVDDHLMKIDIVIRGEEWLSSLPKHLILFKALGWDPPRYAHVPLLLNADRSKLSKRQNAVSVDEYIAKGYLPEALCNFLILLGWNPGTAQEVFTMEKLVEQFSLERVQKAGAIFDLKKLDWLQGQWMRKFSPEKFTALIQYYTQEKLPAAAHDPQLSDKTMLIQDRITFFHEAPEMLRFFYEAPAVSMGLIANPKQKMTGDLIAPVVHHLRTILEAIPAAQWQQETIRDHVEAAVAAGRGEIGRGETASRPNEGTASRSFNKGQLLWTLRAILTGREYSPGAYEVAAVLGKEEVMQRITALL